MEEEENPFLQFIEPQTPEEEENPFLQFVETDNELAQPPAQPTPPSEQDIMRQNALGPANRDTIPQPTMDPTAVEEVVNRPEQGPQAPFRQFTTDIYRTAETFEDAQRLYNEFYNSSYTSRPAGGLGYAIQTNPQTGERTYLVPPSPKWIGGGARANRMDTAATGTASAVGNAVELAGAGLEKIGVEGATRAADNLIPETNTGGSFGDALIAEGVPILASSLIGAGLAWRATQGLGNVARGTASVLSAETAAAAVSDDKAGSILIGENAMLPFSLRGVDLEGSDANDVIEARLNLLADGLLAGGIVQSGVQGVATASKLAYTLVGEPIVNVAFRGDVGIEDKLLNEFNAKLAEALQDVNGSNVNDPQALFEVGERIRALVEANSRVIVPRLDNLEEDFQITLDTVTSLTRGLKPEDGPLIATAQGQRAGLVNTGQAPRTLDRMNEPGRVLMDQTQRYLARVGGETADEQTETMLRGADTLAESGRQEVVQANRTFEDRFAEYNRAASDWISDLANDVELSEEISRLSDVTGTEIDVSRTNARNDILSQIEQGYIAMRDRKNELYSQINGGAIDAKGLVGLLDDLQPGQITEAERQLSSRSPLRRLFQEAQPRQVTEEGIDGSPGTRMETDEERMERFSGFLQSEGMDFGRLYQEVRPELSQLAQRFSGPDGNITVARTMRDVIRWIDEDQVDFVARSNLELADAAREAKRYYSEEFAPLFRDGRLAEYSELYDDTIGGTVRMTTYGADRRSLADTTIRNADPDLVGQFRTLLERPEAGGNSSRLADYIIADTISDAAIALRPSSGTDMDLGGYISRLRQYSEVLNNVFPERAEALNEFVLRVEQTQGNRQQLQALMEEARTNVQTTKQEVATGELRSFFRREFAQDADPLLRDLATASDPQAAFRSVLLSNRNDTTATVQALLDRAASLPSAQREAIQDGMKTAYLRILRDDIFMRTQSTGNAVNVRPARIELNNEQVNSLYNVGDQVFRNSPEVMDTIKLMSEVAGVTAQSRNATPLPSMSATSFNQQAMSATNRLIYTLIGPLSRTGTRVRSAVSSFLQSRDATTRAQMILDRMLADPDYFAELSRKYNRQPNDPIAQEMLLRAITTGAVRSTDNSDDDPFLDQAGRAEMMMRDGIDTLSNEMLDIFQ